MVANLHLSCSGLCIVVAATGKEITPRAFGENVTFHILDFHDGELKMGGRFVINDSVVLEITARSVSCIQFAKNSLLQRKVLVLMQESCYQEK